MAEGAGEDIIWSRRVREENKEKDATNKLHIESLNTQLMVTRQHDFTHQRHKVCSHLWIHETLLIA
jgi:hypothetical protein